MCTKQAIMNALTRSVLGLWLAGASVAACAGQDDWVEQSNRQTQIALDLIAQFEPERAAALGLEGHDEAIADSKPRVFERRQAATTKVIETLKARLPSISNPRVRQDLQLVISAQEDAFHTAALRHSTLLAYASLSKQIFYAFHGLLDPRVQPSRYPAALVRLKRYAGIAPGYEPSTQLVQARMQERFDTPGLLGPFRAEVARDLENNERYIEGIAQLLEKSGLQGWQADFQTLATQLRAHNTWVKAQILPRARSTNQLPEAVYADNLKQYGVRADPHDLIERGTFSFIEIRNEMNVLAKHVAAKHAWKSANYRDVIRELKKAQIKGDNVIGFYRERLSQIEAIIRREHIVTLPQREMTIRLASAAESAALPVPHVSTPRLIGNQGEHAEFVIPLENPNSVGSAQIDDFSFDAVAWTLTAHEARPGHELQFAAMLENGVSVPRAVFAFNSANVEGWALYAEALMKEHLPLEGQLLSLQERLMRAARLFLDPMLNLGLMKPEQAKDFLMREVVLSEAMATQEVDRYTYEAPGQATSYFYGLMKFESMRAKIELHMGERFNEQAFHDFILRQGLLPLDLLEQAVFSEFVKP